ncbi:hypothetical protein AALO_G00194310 [Alosa alosa]|uniref:Uncharacterized protein n=1 Tax=Alosa alosa TaxID=278164 RepID=A0AAV6G630_9TELE|nr:hypothetical protein AALO_G00194310 [Alosa alosa]
MKPLWPEKLVCGSDSRASCFCPSGWTKWATAAHRWQLVYASLLFRKSSIHSSAQRCLHKQAQGTEESERRLLWVSGELSTGSPRRSRRERTDGVRQQMPSLTHSYTGRRGERESRLTGLLRGRDSLYPPSKRAA